MPQLRHGPIARASVVILQPLFEEANRTRRVLMQVMRGLSDRQVGSILPDLPGTGDSTIATVDARLEDWRVAVGELLATLPTPRLTVAVRGGCLFDGAADARWRLAPVAGASLIRDVVRATALSGEVKAADLDTTARAAPTRLAGNLIHPALYSALADAVPEGDAHVAALPGTPWRRAEPGDDDALVVAMVADIADWVATCAKR